ncbi:hypothetical protein J6590_077133 [Homalodisca vitripennis]|nr:hypothetical protein J6590_077133 [Homalodisca vitripennis]
MQIEEESRNLSILVTEVKNHFNTFFEELLNENMSSHSPLIQLEAGFRYEFVLLQQSVIEYLNEIDDLIKLLPQRRGKRGLVDAGDVKEIYISEEKELFSSEQETAVKVLQGLNERLGTLFVKEYRPEDVVRHLNSHILFNRKLYAAKVAAAGSFGLVSILMLVYICYRFFMSVMTWWTWWSSRRNRRRQRRSATLTEVFAKVRGLTSLDSPEGDQEGVNPVEINAVEQNVEAVEVVNLERLRDVIQAL